MGIERPGLRKLALEVFGTGDEITPTFPKHGEQIQEAMEKAYDLGKASR